MIARLLETRHAGWGLLLLRVIFGVSFMMHGYDKLFGEGGMQGMTENLTGMAVPAPELFAWLVALTELVGGLFLVLGLLTRLAALATVINMSVAIALVHWGNGFFVANTPPGVELPLLYLAASATLFVAGAGRLSIDEALAAGIRRRRGEPVNVREREVGWSGRPPQEA